MSLANNPEWTRFEDARRIAWASMLATFVVTLASTAFNRIDVRHDADPDLDKYGNGAAFYVIGNLGVGMMFGGAISGSYRTMIVAVLTMLAGLASCAVGVVHEIKQPGEWVNFNMAYWITDLVYTATLAVNFGVAAALASHLGAARLIVVREAMNKDASNLTAIDHAAVGELDLCLNPNDYKSGFSSYWLLGKGINNSRDLYSVHMLIIATTIACMAIYYGGFLAASWNSGIDGQRITVGLTETVWLVDVAPNYAAAAISFGIPSFFVGAQAAFLIAPSLRAQIPAIVLALPAIAAAVVGNVYDRAFTHSTFVKTMTIIHTVLLGGLCAIATMRAVAGASPRLRRLMKEQP